jgi:hypothetical protein
MRCDIDSRLYQQPPSARSDRPSLSTHGAEEWRPVAERCYEFSAACLTVRRSMAGRLSPATRSPSWAKNAGPRTGLVVVLVATIQPAESPTAESRWVGISEILEVATLISMGGFEAGASGWASIERSANAAFGPLTTVAAGAHALPERTGTEPPSKSLKARRDTARGLTA